MYKENMTQERISEYTRVAYYYYKAGLTQDEIAKKMQMSRQRVNRIIRDCTELGIVQITIAGLENSHLDLEISLEKKYGLKEVRIVENVIEENIYKDLGITAGKYLESVIKDNDIIGFSRGRSVAELVDCMPKIQKKNLTVTQLLGSENKDKRHMEVDDIVYRFSERLQARQTMLYAPVIVQNEDLRTSMMKEQFFVDAYEVVKSCTIAVVGIGTASSQWKHMVDLQTSDSKKEKWAADVKGEVCTHFFDAQGKEVIPPFRNRIVSITLDDYLKIPMRIGVAGQKEKAEAIRAALTGGYVNVLITDFETAQILNR